MTLEEALNLAIQHHRAGQLAQAESVYRQILAHQPGDAQVPLNLGSLLHDQGRYDEALAVYQHALSLNPDGSGPTWTNLSNTLCEMDRLAESIAAARRALELDPDSFGAYNNLGNALKKTGQLDEANAAYRKAIALRPGFAFAHNNLGFVLHRQGDLPGAMACFRQALKLTPDYPEALSNLGNVYCDMGRWDDGMACCRRGMALRPDYASVHWNLGLMLLRQGDFARGWPEYEWRWRVKHLILPPMKYTHPWWDGSDLRGRRILIHAEQGLGDTIQFVRYVPRVMERGGTVILHYPDDLHALLGDFSGVAQCIPWSAPLPEFDVHCPLLSLPRIFATTLADVPAKTPYLFADEALVRGWRERVGRERGLKVGLAWAGRPTHLGDRRRSMPLTTLGPLGQIANARFYSLQVGDAARQVNSPPHGLNLTDFSDQLTDFSQTAALIANLDLVICVDTAVAHLAGAMGRPMWLLLPLSPDWRWMLNRSDSPWYPTMRLFRQSVLNDWSKPVAEVVRALKNAVEEMIIQ